MKKISKETKKMLKAKYDSLAGELLTTADPAKVTALKQDMDLYSSILDANRVEWKVSPDTILIIVGNLAGILLILKYEKLDIITSKALGFVIKGRV